MSCSPFDLKDYFFGELPEPDRKHTESHLAACASCRDELAALDLTRAALLSVPDEEPPRRIAFVSDKVFEPRWWQRIWTSGPQLGFSAAALLAAAIVVHGFTMRPVAPALTAAAVPDQVIEAEVAKRVGAEVARVLAASEQRQLARTLDLVNAKLREARADQRNNLLKIVDYLERLEKKNSMVRRTLYDQ
jgi:anti-sigma factor RsiW